MKINVHAGHGPDGKVACGAVKFLKESTEARNVKSEVIRQLRAFGHTVYDCTVDNGTSQTDVLNKIVTKCNANTVDLDVSIHFNAGAAVQKKNGRTTGTEVLVYSEKSKAISYARDVLDEITGIGFAKRAVKFRPELKYLRSVKAPAMLIECCFVDDEDDAALYDCQKMASAIARGITGKKSQDSDAQGDGKKVYRVQVGAYSSKENAAAMQEKLKKLGVESVLICS